MTNLKPWRLWTMSILCTDPIRNRNVIITGQSETEKKNPSGHGNTESKMYIFQSKSMSDKGYKSLL